MTTAATASSKQTQPVPVASVTATDPMPITTDIVEKINRPLVKGSWGMFSTAFWVTLPTCIVEVWTLMCALFGAYGT